MIREHGTALIVALCVVGALVACVHLLKRPTLNASERERIPAMELRDSTRVVPPK